jgi:hypothetical protein
MISLAPERDLTVAPSLWFIGNRVEVISFSDTPMAPC